ncbi:hypothetical protein Vretimale_6746 [Volvox reticuliferus]|nr:hypothetical protein Vretimale_6746 [Volvox reticuliferus]
MVPSFPEDVLIPENDAEAEPSCEPAAELSEEEPAAKLPMVADVASMAMLGIQGAFQMPQPASLFFQSVIPQPAIPPMPLPVPVVVPSAPQPKSAAAYNAVLAAGANLTREQRVARYREKRKNRKFEKTIRYASRKAYAEIRPRIKGRFAKKEEIEAWKAAHGGDDAVVPEVLDADF